MNIRIHIKFWSAALLSLLLTACAINNSATRQTAAADGPDNPVVFPISCNDQSQSEFEDSVAMLHNMMYAEAEKGFTALSEKNPDCAMAFWGIAMTQFHPLWPGQTRDAALQKGQAAISQAKARLPETQREKDYIDAADQYFKDADRLSHQQRLKNWEAAQLQLHRQYPDDLEAAVFYALAHLSTAAKGDPDFTHQQQAGALLEQLYTDHPAHPGVLHYTIHAYDNQLLAPRAVPAAQTYYKTAPDVPHALHMPTHIFVRLGHWDEVIDLNKRSARAALKYPVNGKISHHNPHAQDYLIYAYMQQAKTGNAEQVLQESVALRDYQQSFVSGYALAAMPARFYLERHLWQEAAKLAVNQPEEFPWEKYPENEAITYYARGLGAARIGDQQATEASIQKLDALYRKTAEVGQQYWTLHIDVYRKTIAAWLLYAQGRQDAAIALMTEAANQEDSVNKHPVTPGAILPARELLGDMLLMSGHYPQALSAYQKSMITAPNRLNSLYGAGRAAQQSGNQALADQYYTQLIKLTENGDTRPDIEAVKASLTQTG